MNIPRFNIDDRKNAFDFYKKHGAMIFSDLTNQNDIDKIHKQLHDLISLQISRHMNTNSNFLPGNGFDRGLIEFSHNYDDLRSRLYNITQGLSSLYAFAVNPLFEEIAIGIGLKNPIYYTPPQFRFDIPHDDRFLQPPHQEIRGSKSPNSVAFLTALCDIPENKGALQVALGSHKLGPIMPTVDKNMNSRYQYVSRESFEDKYPLESVSLIEGETLVFNKYTVHASSQNVSDEIRWQTILRFEDYNSMPYLNGDDTFEKDFDPQEVFLKN